MIALIWQGTLARIVPENKAQDQNSYADKSLCADSIVGEEEPGNGNREHKD